MKKIFSYFSEAWQEMKKVTWPSRKESIRLSISVIVFTVILAVIIGLFDSFLSQIIEKII